MHIALKSVEQNRCCRLRDLRDHSGGLAVVSSGNEHGDVRLGRFEGICRRCCGHYLRDRWFGVSISVRKMDGGLRGLVYRKRRSGAYKERLAHSF